MSCSWGTGQIWVLFMESRGDVGPGHDERGKDGERGTREIWVLFIGNRGDIGPVPREQGDIGPVHGEQGRYGFCS